MSARTNSGGESRTAASSLVQLIARAETQARALQASARTLRLVAGGWRLVAASHEGHAVSTFAAPNWDDPDNILDNPLVPDWDVDFINDLISEQNKLADFYKGCEEKFQQDIEHAAQAKDVSTQMKETLAAMQRYEQCLLRRHPTHEVPSPD